MPSPFGQALKILQIAALLLALVLIINLAVHGWLGAILEAAALFLAMAIAVNLAVYGWLGALGAWSGKEAHTGDRLAHLLIAGTFTLLQRGLDTPSLSRFARFSSQELFEITNVGELPFHALG